jgi:hypothetical protein
MLQPLHFAAGENNVTKIQQLINSGEPINCTASESQSQIEHISANAFWLGRKAVGWTTAGLLGSLGVFSVMTSPFTGGLTGFSVGTVLSVAGAAAKEIASSDICLDEFTFNRQGWTALHFAAAHNALDAAKYLILLGADYNIKSADGKTFLQVAGELYIESFICEMNAFIHAHQVLTQSLNMANHQITQLAGALGNQISTNQTLVTALTDEQVNHNVTMQQRNAYARFFQQHYSTFAASSQQATPTVNPSM